MKEIRCSLVKESERMATQAVLVTNQIYAGSLGADALAAAAIGFTVRLLTTPQQLMACMRSMSLNKQSSCYKLQKVLR